MAQKRAKKAKSTKAARQPQDAAETLIDSVAQVAEDPRQPGVEETVAFDRLAAALATEFSLTPPRVEPSPKSTRASEACLEEIMDDLLQLMRSVTAVRDALSDVVARMDRIEQTVFSSSKAQVQQLDSLGRNLIGDRKAYAALSTLNAIVPWMESLRTMRDRLTSKKEGKLRNQMDAALDRTVMLLQTLGFEEFQVGEGEPFNPEFMECVGYAEGTPGTVLSMRTSGYLTGGSVVRPAGVLVADPRVSKPTTNET